MPNALAPFRGVNLAEIDQQASENALSANRARRIPVQNQIQDLQLQQEQQGLQDSQRKSAADFLGNQFVAIAQSQDPIKAAQMFVGSPQFQAAGKIVGLPTEQFTVTPDDKPEHMVSQSLMWAKVLGKNVPPQMQTIGDPNNPGAKGLLQRNPQTGEMRQVVAPQKDDGQLVQTVGPDGKPVWTPRSKAVGMTPFNPALAAQNRPVDTSDPIVQNWAHAVLNGNATMQQVPASHRDSVAAFMDQQPKEAYSPQAASRMTLAASRIASNYLKLPQYELTANGLPYLQRIDAAMKTPGSVSDQDLLDSLVKLNTAGNAVTEAQVHLITGGKSFSDMAGTFQNKFKNGGVLSDNQRQQVATIAKAIFANYQKGYEPVYRQVTSQLKQAGIPEAFWSVPNLNNLSAQIQSQDQPSTSGPHPPDIQAILDSLKPK